MTEKDRLMKKIQAEDFALYETVLFLDGHPCDATALEFYKIHREIIEKLKREYIEKYGPLTIYDNVCGTSWDYVKTPWPWEREAN